MKRIIGGVTYNTETSTKVAYKRTFNESEDEDEDHTLYITRRGAVFVHVHDRFDEVAGRFEAMTKREAQDWILIGDVEIFQDNFLDEPPEAEEVEASGQQAAIYLRMPMVLKKSIENRSEKTNQSVTAWILRTLEERLREEDSSTFGTKTGSQVDLSSENGLRKIGFDGFLAVAELRDSKLGDVAKTHGVYLVMTDPNAHPRFLPRSPAGHFKGKDPTVSIPDLKTNWVFGASILYFGMTRDSLKKRIGTLLKYGEGKPVGHRGGRYLWQIDMSKDFKIAWMPVTDRDPRDVESELMEQFAQQYGALPFANLQR